MKPGFAPTDVEPGGALDELVRLYSDPHARHGLDACSRWEYGFGRFDNGVEIGTLLRQLYAAQRAEARARFGDPFEATRADSFFHWATRPAADGLSPFLVFLYRSRPDLAAAFPDVPGDDLEAFVHWAREHGPGESGYESELVRLTSPAPPM